MALTQISQAGAKDEAINEAKIQISNAGTNGQFLQKQSGNTGGLTWATVSTTPEGEAIQSTTNSNEAVTKFLRADGDGTCSWQVPPDTNTTYSVQDGQLSQNNFTDADHTKLNGIAASANNYVHPNHSGEVTSTADGATVIASDVVDEDNLKISNAGSNGQFLSKQSGDTGGLTWATVSTSDATKMPLAGGTFTGDVVFDNATNADNDLHWDESEDHLKWDDNVKAVFGDGNDMVMYSDGANGIIRGVNADLYLQSDSDVFITDIGGNETFIKCINDAQVELYHNNVKKLETTTTGVTVTGNLIPEANDTRDLGASGTRWANIYTNDLNLSNEGSTNSVDGTWGSFTIQEGEEDLFLINKRNGKKYKFNLTEVIN